MSQTRRRIFADWIGRLVALLIRLSSATRLAIYYWPHDSDKKHCSSARVQRCQHQSPGFTNCLASIITAAAITHLTSNSITIRSDHGGARSFPGNSIARSRWLFHGRMQSAWYTPCGWGRLRKRKLAFRSATSILVYRQTISDAYSHNANPPFRHGTDPEGLCG